MAVVSLWMWRASRGPVPPFSRITGFLLHPTHKSRHPTPLPPRLQLQLNEPECAAGRRDVWVNKHQMLQWFWGDFPIQDIGQNDLSSSLYQGLKEGGACEKSHSDAFMLLLSLWEFDLFTIRAEMKKSPLCPVVLVLRLCLDLTSTLVDAGVVGRLLDKNGPWVMLGVLDVCGLFGRNCWKREKVVQLS